MQSLHSNKWGPIALRVGLALTLLWSVLTKFRATEKVVGLFNNLGFSFVSPGIIIAVAIFLLVVSLLLLAGKYLHVVGLLLSGFFAVSILAGIFAGDKPFSIGPAIWKDFALLGTSMYFMFKGSGNCCNSREQE